MNELQTLYASEMRVRKDMLSAIAILESSLPDMRFCYHAHYALPCFSFWRRGCDESAMVQVDETGALFLTKAMPQKDEAWHEDMVARMSQAFNCDG